MSFILRHWKLILAVGLVAGAFWGGWMVNGWRIESNQAEAYRGAVERATAELRAKLKTEQRESLNLADRLADLETRNEKLREEIENADYQAPPEDNTDPVSGICPAHPVNDPDWLRDYNRAARAGRSDSA